MNDLFTKEKLEWVDDCRVAARRLLTIHNVITIEDVLAICPRPRYIHKNTTGQVFRHDDFKAVGFTKARRPISKGRWIMQWKLTEYPELTK